jgi:predicted permease
MAMGNFILIFVYLFLGLALQRVKFVPITTYKLLNKIAVNFCLPALALFYIPKIHWNNQLLYPIGAAWIGFGASFLFFYFLGKKLGWSRKLTGCLILTAGLSNTSFLGFPIISAIYGPEGMKTAIMVDQPGSFVVLSTLGVLVATMYSKGVASAGQILKKVLFFPPFLTFIFACTMNIFNFDFLDIVQIGMHSIGNLITPLALISVGLQLSFDSRSAHWRFLRLGLLFKLILMPALFYVGYILILGQRSTMIDVVIMETAMAPMITGSILASTYGLKPRLSSMMIGFGIPLSFLTLACWYLILKIF